MLRAGFLCLQQAGPALYSLTGQASCRTWALELQASAVASWGISSCGSRALGHRLNSCGTWAYFAPCTWHLPRPGIEFVSPALAGSFTGPPMKSQHLFLKMVWDGHSDQYECLAHRTLICIFLIISDAEHIFMCPSAICRPSLDKYPFWSLVHFFLGLYLFLILSCSSCFCVLERNPWWVSFFANISSYFEGCPLSFGVSFGTQMLLWLIWSHFLICNLFSTILRGGSTKSLLHVCQVTFCLYFFLNNFIVSIFAFRYLYYWGFIFCRVLRSFLISFSSWLKQPSQSLHNGCHQSTSQAWVEECSLCLHTLSSNYHLCRFWQ